VLTRDGITRPQPSSNTFSASIDRDCEALRSRVNRVTPNFRDVHKAKDLIEAIEAMLLILQDFKVRHDLATLNRKQNEWVTCFLGALSRLRVITVMQ
jgi:hypothetical protein